MGFDARCRDVPVNLSAVDIDIVFQLDRKFHRVLRSTAQTV